MVKEDPIDRGGETSSPLESLTFGALPDEGSARSLAGNAEFESFLSKEVDQLAEAVRLVHTDWSPDFSVSSVTELQSWFFSQLEQIHSADSRAGVAACLPLGDVLFVEAAKPDPEALGAIALQVGLYLGEVVHRDSSQLRWHVVGPEVGLTDAAGPVLYQTDPVFHISPIAFVRRGFTNFRLQAADDSQNYLVNFVKRLTDKGE